MIDGHSISLLEKLGLSFLGVLVVPHQSSKVTGLQLLGCCRVIRVPGAVWLGIVLCRYKALRGSDLGLWEGTVQ